MARVLFISDLHLSHAREATNQRFLRFLEEHGAGAQALYVLGDLFEYWIGDDDLLADDGDVLGRRIAGAFAALVAGGTPVFIMHGNRDFLIGGGWCVAARATLLEDPTVAEIGGERTLLMHGDTLCTDDKDYQAWRKTSRSDAWQREFLSRPVSERRRLAGELRDASREATRAKPDEIMDVNQNAVRSALLRHGVRRLIHGHTHRPALHEWEIGKRAFERWVLPDWYGTGGYLEIGAQGPRLVFF